MIDPLALTALIVSLVALLATIGQLLQQYFATADGFRRCQPSVMVLWARKTKLRWRWAEFRFETLFVIPRMTCSPLDGDVGIKTGGSSRRCSLVNSRDSLEKSMTLGGWGSYDAERYYDSDELVCWVPLLAQLHRQGEESIKHFLGEQSSKSNNATLPSIQFVTKSWDFMPPDFVRPLASTTVSMLQSWQED